MHRHGYQGKKFGRESGPRKALLKGLAESLVREGSLTTTKPKAKELVPYFEKLITKAKKGGLSNRRLIMRDLTVSASHKLVDEIAPKLKGRNSGHLRIKSAGYKRGDNSPIAKVSFVDDIFGKVVEPKATKATPAKQPATAKKPKSSAPETALESETNAVTPVQKSSPSNTSTKIVAKRSGVRGNR